jgi:hypothetical protein
MPVYDMVDRSSLHTLAQRGGALRGVVCFFPPVDPAVLSVQAAASAIVPSAG